MKLTSRMLTAIALASVPWLTFAPGGSTASQPSTIQGATSYVYKTTEQGELRLHVINPGDHSATDERSAIVLFFGGGWTQGSVTQLVSQARYLAERGMVAIVADYRVYERHGTSAFEGMADARSAIGWVRAHAGQLGIDSTRIAAGGASAGGHLALSAAVFDEPTNANSDLQGVSARPDALVLFNPAVDTVAGTDRIRSLLQARFGDRAREGSPIHHLRPGLPPTLILHGKSDATVAYADVERFCSESSAMGNDCRLIGYDNASHGFFNPQRRGGQFHRATLIEIEGFLTDIGFLGERAVR